MQAIFKDANGKHPAFDLLGLQPIGPAPGKALGDIAATHAIPSLIRQGAAVELRHADELSALDLAALIHAIFHDDNLDVRRSAIDSLAQIGRVELALPVLVACCFDADTAIVMASLDQLTEISPATVATFTISLFSKLQPEDLEDIAAVIELARLKLNPNVID